MKGLFYLALMVFGFIVVIRLSRREVEKADKAAEADRPNNCEKSSE